MALMKYSVIFRDGNIPPNDKEAYSVEEVQIPESYSDDPLGWVAANYPEEGRHIVACVPKEGLQHLIGLLSAKKPR